MATARAATGLLRCCCISFDSDEMTNISRGQRLKLQDIGLADKPFTLDVALSENGLSLDMACFGLDAARKLSDERYMTFFNQPHTPCGAVRVAGERSFAFDLQRLPTSVEVLVITVALDGTGTMKILGPSTARFVGGAIGPIEHCFDGSVFDAERAIMLFEIYRKDGAWRLNAVCQGFNGGLDALIVHFGGTIADAPAPQLANAIQRISLEKRVECEAPQLVSLVKQAKISLEKAGLAEHRARVCLCLDISGSMSKLYKTGAVQQFAERILALACRFDDDGAIDVFLFGAGTHNPAPMTLSNCSDYVRVIMKQFPLEGDTRYGRAMAAIRQFYFKGAGSSGANQIYRADTPVYVMFLTDGGTSDKATAERQLRESSYEPIFWQFMGIGKGRKSKSKGLLSFADSDFPFLEKLDELSGRLIDNANFFSVLHPEEHSEDALYELLMTEYPQWVREARNLGMFA